MADQQSFSDRDNDALSALSALASSLQPNSFQWPSEDVDSPHPSAGGTNDEAWDPSALEGLVDDPLQQEQHAGMVAVGATGGANELDEAQSVLQRLAAQQGQHYYHQQHHDPNLDPSLVDHEPPSVEHHLPQSDQLQYDNQLPQEEDDPYQFGQGQEHDEQPEENDEDAFRKLAAEDLTRDGSGDGKGSYTVNRFALNWLHDNYMPSSHASVQRNAMFASYVAACEAADEKAVNAASFGKSMKHAFNGIKTRRLGTRNNSKYHYCGIMASNQDEKDRLLQMCEAPWTENVATAAVVVTKADISKLTADQEIGMPHEDDNDELEPNESFDGRRASNGPSAHPEASSSSTTRSKRGRSSAVETAATASTAAGKRRRTSAGASDAGDQEDEGEMSYAPPPAPAKKGKKEKAPPKKTKKALETEAAAQEAEERQRAEEERYLSGLKEGFDGLRDAVPALRVLFRTSTHQTLETDQPDPTTGLIDGLPPLTKESKITIVAAARDYVVHLRREREKLDRQRKGLEEFIKGIEGGEAALEAWKQSFDESERLLAQEQALAAANSQALSHEHLDPADPSQVYDPSQQHPQSFDASHLGEYYDQNTLDQFAALYQQGGSESNEAAALALAGLAPALAAHHDQSQIAQLIQSHQYQAALQQQQQQHGAGGGSSQSPTGGRGVGSVKGEVQMIDPINDPDGKKYAKQEEARAKNRKKQMLYRERQKAKMQDLERKIRTLEKGP